MTRPILTNGWDDKMGTTGWSAELIQPDIMLPSQFFNKHQTEFEPERSLMLAVFVDAIQTLTRENAKRHHKADALEWVMYDGPDDPYAFSFLRICEEFEFEPSLWRKWAQSKDIKPVVQFLQREVNAKHRHSWFKPLHLVESIS